MNHAEGIVTDGGIRDVPTIEGYGLVVYAANPTPKAGPSDIVFYDWDLPIQCGGALVRPGDVVVGDEAGVVVIPAPLAEEAASYSIEHEEAEEFAKGLIEKEGCNPGRYYPITEETMRLFRETKKKSA
jgi:regulator of RNase E activity RraA